MEKVENHKHSALQRSGSGFRRAKWCYPTCDYRIATASDHNIAGRLLKRGHFTATGRVDPKGPR
jgi:hypothetical protein